MSDLLKASNIFFAYGDRPALREVSLELAPGELVAIIGPNGSGKSTLIRALLGQLHASGSIEWESRPLREWNSKELARRIAYLPQSPSADPEQTVAQTLRLGRAPYWKTFGLESEGDERVVRDVAQMLALDELLNRPLAELSGGQRQRAFIGRCLVQQPVALLLDEPSTYLDLKHQIELLKLLRTLSRKKSLGILMASHDVNLAAAFADRMILLNEGTIAGAGSVSEVMQPELLERVYGLQLRLIENAGQRLIVPVT